MMTKKKKKKIKVEEKRRHLEKRKIITKKRKKIFLCVHFFDVGRSAYDDLSFSENQMHVNASPWQAGN